MFESAINVALNAKPYAPSEEFADASSEALLVNRIDKDDAMDLMHESVKNLHTFHVYVQTGVTTNSSGYQLN